MVPHGWGNPAGRVDTPASPVLPLEGSWAACCLSCLLFIVERELGWFRDSLTHTAGQFCRPWAVGRRLTILVWAVGV